MDDMDAAQACGAGRDGSHTRSGGALAPTSAKWEKEEGDADDVSGSSPRDPAGSDPASTAVGGERAAG
jgi:hypothetical protein